MREFFKGWRRKLGCGLLMMACALMVMWLRSRSLSEDAFLPFGQQATLQLISRNSTLTVRKFVSRFRAATAKAGPDRILLLGVYPPTQRSTGHVAFSADETNRLQLGTPYAWTFKICGIGLATFQDNDLPVRVAIYTIPYWSMVLPLTFLSAWLILWKPKKHREDSSSSALSPNPQISSPAS